jgi:hypothetical protein
VNTVTGCGGQVVEIATEHVQQHQCLGCVGGGECIRVKYLSTHNEIAHNTFGPCGLVNFDLAENRKNGEGIYIGTAPEQLRSKNPTPVPDASDSNWIHHNVITAPAECVEAKESAEHNVIERNRCFGGTDPKGAGRRTRTPSSRTPPAGCHSSIS